MNKDIRHENTSFCVHTRELLESTRRRGMSLTRTQSTKPLWERLMVRSLLLIFGLLLYASPTQAQNVSVSDYSVPVSRADNLRIDALSLDYQSVGDSIVSQTGNLVLVYKKFYESLPFAYSIDLRSSASFRRDTQKNELVGNAASDILARLKKYKRDEGNFFVFGDTDLDLNDDFDRPGLKSTVGIGWGRFINATALRKAVRIEDFMIKEGVIEERMPKETMIELGHIIEKEAEYQELYGDRYQNYWYEDMQNEIQKSRKVLGSIGAIGVLRMQEVLEKERINERFYGWDLSAGVQLDVLTPTRGAMREDPAFSLGLRYSRPISWGTQINTDFSINSPFNGDFGRRYNIGLQTDFIYEITNKINLTLVHLLSLTKNENQKAQHDNIGSAGFNFFIENKINLNTAFVVRKDESTPWRVNFTTGLSYRIF
jgi:hypothetical protein